MMMMMMEGARHTMSQFVLAGTINISPNHKRYGVYIISRTSGRIHMEPKKQFSSVRRKFDFVIQIQLASSCN